MKPLIVSSVSIKVGFMFIRLFHQPKRRYFIFILLIIVVGCGYSMVKQLDMNPTIIVHQMKQWGNWSIIGFLSLYFGLTIIGIPAIPITVAGGVCFGIIWGTILSVLAATLGAIAAFGLTRSYLKDWVQKTIGHHPALIRFNRATLNYPLKFVLFVRLAPVFPFNLSNFLFGLTPIGYKPYIIGTLLGIIPGTLTYTGLGVTGKYAIEQGHQLSIFLSLILGIILCLFPLFKRVSDREK